MRSSSCVFGVLGLLALPFSTAGAGTTGSAGGGQPIGNHQPSLAINHVIRLTGEASEVGEVGFFGGDFAPLGWAFPEGQALDPRAFPELFDKIGTTYGGDGESTFALPDLRGSSLMGVADAPGLTNRMHGDTLGARSRVLTETHLPSHSHTLPQGLVTDPVGGGLAASILQPSVVMTPIIATTGTFPARSLMIDGGPAAISNGGEPFLGEIAWTAGDEIPAGWAAANGELVSISQNPALFSILGTTYGGDGRSTFGLPDLRGRLGVGEGQGVGLSDRRLGEEFGAEEVALSSGQIPLHDHSLTIGPATGSAGAAAANPHNNTQPSLGLNYIIAVRGDFPSESSEVGSDQVLSSTPAEIGSGSNPLLGSIIPFAGSFAPRGWAFADGQILSISSNSALFVVLGGNTYGGDGETTFALPDLRGRVLVHPDQSGLPGDVFGERFGAETSTLTLDELPEHSHAFDDFLTGDYNGDGRVDAADYTTWRDAFTSGDLRADSNHDGLIDQTDYLIWRLAFGDTLAQDALAVPEPASVGSVALVLLTLNARRRNPLRSGMARPPRSW